MEISTVVLWQGHAFKAHVKGSAVVQWWGHTLKAHVKGTPGVSSDSSVRLVTYLAKEDQGRGCDYYYYYYYYYYYIYYSRRVPIAQVVVCAPVMWRLRVQSSVHAG